MGLKFVNTIEAHYLISLSPVYFKPEGYLIQASKFSSKFWYFKGSLAARAELSSIQSNKRPKYNLILLFLLII